MVPLFVAYIFILIPRLYLAQDYQLFAMVQNDQGESYIENNLFKYAVRVFPTLYLKISWLWFLPALFIDSNINYACLSWAQRRKSKIPFDNEDIKLISGQILAVGIWGSIGVLG